MSAPIAPAVTEAQQILNALDKQNLLLERLTKAVNSVGEGQNWIIENVKGLFEMLNNPMFKSMLPGVMAAGAEGLPGGE